MKRLLALCVLAAGILAIPLLQLGNADPPKDDQDKVLVCHVSGNDGTGTVISVNDDAIAAHRAHGDCFLKCAEPGDDCVCKKEPPPGK